MVEFSKGKQIADIYFDTMNKIKKCFEVTGVRTHEVFFLKKSVVRAYDYYNKGNLNDFYNAK